MIPKANPSTGYLPPGLHKAPWAELLPRFGTNTHRTGLLGGLLNGLRNLFGAGCREVILDGSFVSEKELPQDYDAAWETAGVNPALLDPVLLDFTYSRAAMKAKYGGEFFPASAYAAAGVLYRDFFQKDRNGVSKGVCKSISGACHDQQRTAVPNHKS
jgi:hypothetical protein